MSKTRRRCQGNPGADVGAEHYVGSEAAHGSNDHGDTVLTDGTHRKHWVSGDERIFGNYTGGHLVFIGHGRHTGSGNSQYNVSLVHGGTTKATTA